MVQQKLKSKTKVKRPDSRSESPPQGINIMNANIYSEKEAQEIAKLKQKIDQQALLNNSVLEPRKRSADDLEKVIMHKST